MYLLGICVGHFWLDWPHAPWARLLVFRTKFAPKAVSISIGVQACGRKSGARSGGMHPAEVSCLAKAWNASLPLVWERCANVHA